MQPNLDEAPNKSCEVERKLPWEYIEAFDETVASTAHLDKALADDAEQRYEELKLGQRPRRNIEQDKTNRMERVDQDEQILDAR